MVTKEQKSIVIKDLEERLKRATGIYVINYEGMNIPQVENFRKKMRDIECDYKVAKNSLIKIAAKNVGGFDLPEDKMVGMSGVIFTYDDPTAPAKIIKELFDKQEKPALRLAVLDGQVFDGAELDKVAALLSKEDMYSAIVGSISAPASGIHGVLNGVIRDIASIIEEVAKKQNVA